MCAFTKSIFILPLLFLHVIVNGQATIKEQTAVAYGIWEQDTTIRFRKTTQYDSLGRLMNKQNYYYRDKGVLIREEKAFYDVQNSLLTEQTISYPKEKEPIHKKLITQYLDYQKKEKDSKYILRQLYDKYGELAKEDTATYDPEGNLSELCNYNYTGGTSLFCNYYQYKNKLQTRWKTYAKWTTINIKGMVVERQAKRRDFRYRYNKRGQLIRSWGKHYSRRFCQTIKYDKNHKILEDKTISKRRSRVLNKNKEKPSKKKYYLHKEETIFSYQEGRLVKELKLINKKEIHKKEISYQDSLIQKIQTSSNGNLIQEVIFSYNSQQKKNKKITKKYNKNGQLRYSVVTHYNSAEKPIKEEQIIGKKTLSILTISYDQEGNPIEQSLSAQNNKSLEKTLYIYKYY